VKTKTYKAHNMKTAPLILTLLIGILPCLLTGCQTQRDNSQKSLIDIIKHFDDNGLKVTVIQPSFAKAIKAQEGCQLTIDGSNIEIYRYNLKEPEQAEKLRQIHKDGYIDILSIKFEVNINGPFLMLHGNSHPDNVKIIEVFDSF